jgi:DNA polymerase-3 subunit delta
MHPARSGVLVLSVRSWPANTKLAKLVAQAGTAVECKTPPERQLPAWCVELAKTRFKAKLDNEAARLLVELVGPEVALLASEIEKLATYVGERAVIQRADVARMVGAGRVEAIWNALEAATTGQTSEALELLGRLLDAGEHPVGLLAALGAALRKAYHAGQLRLSQKSLQEACAEAGIYPFAVEKTGRQHKHLGPARVGRIPALLLRADLDLKGSSSLAPRAVLEQMLVELARPREEEAK